MYGCYCQNTSVCSFVRQPRGASSRRVQALYDCEADHHDELSFSEGQVLVVLEQEDSDWWVRIIQVDALIRGGGAVWKDTGNVSVTHTQYCHVSRCPLNHPHAT